MKIAVLGQRIKEENLPYIKKLFGKLTKEDIKLFIYNEYAENLKRHNIHTGDFTPFFNEKDLKEYNPEILFTLGGDGTILNTITLVEDSGIPIMGINLGRMGFLASIEKGRIEEALSEVIRGEYFTEDRSLIRLESNIPLFGDNNYALNDFTLHKRDTSSMITIRTFVNGRLFNVYWADGIIVSTPTGSTGYSLSCGGPIIFPKSGNFVITPVAPHNLNVRPVVLSDESEISFEIEGRSANFLCTLDSRYETITSEHKITIKKADFKVTLAHTHDITFMKTINDKLLWGLDLRN